MKIITILLLLNLFVGGIYHLMIVDELKADLYTEQQLNKACTGELLWKEIQINDLKVSQ